MATMKDVARLAGVSTATVSRAIMTPEKVSPATRSRVEAAVTESGYTPHIQMSRSLKRSESKTIVAIVPDISDMYFADLIRGVEETAHANGYLMLVGDSHSQDYREETFVNMAYRKQADGLILLGTDLPFGISKAEQRFLPPLVMACEYSHELDLPTVHIDNLTAAFEAVNYLTRLGHQHIAQISGPIQSNLCQFRNQGYLQAIRRSGVELDESLTVYTEFSLEGGKQAAHSLMTRKNPPTAIFCHSDSIAIGALHEVKRLGFNVPEDVSIIGFDDIDMVQYTEPPLTTISQPRYEIGRQAMLKLLEVLRGKPNGNSDSRSCLLETELIVRQSTDVCRKR